MPPTITLAGGTAPNLDIETASSLILSGSTGVSVSLGAGATGSIAGKMSVMGGPHRLLAADPGAVIVSGFSAQFTTDTGFTGNPFGSTGAANVVPFENGASYTQNAGSDPFGLAAPNGKIVFQSGTSCLYNINSGFSASGRTYATLELGYGVTIAASGSGDFTVDQLTVLAGSSFTYTGSGTSKVTVNAGLSNGGTTLSLTAGSGGIAFGGAEVALTGTGTITLGNSVSTLSNSGCDVYAPLALPASGSVFSVNGELLVGDGGSVTGGTFVYAPSATLVFAAASSAITVSNTDPYWPVSSGPTHVTANAAGFTMSAGASRVISAILLVAAPIGNAGQLIVSGTIEMVDGGSLTASPVYSGAGYLMYDNTVKTVGPEWGTGTIVGLGVPAAVLLSNAFVTLPATDRTVAGTLTLDVFSSLTLSSTGDLKTTGNVSGAGQVHTNGRTIWFNGTSTQTIAAGASLPWTWDKMVIDKASGNVQLLDTNLTLTATTGNALQILNNGAFDLHGSSSVSHTLTFSGAGGGILAGGTSGGSVRLITGSYNPTTGTYDTVVFTGSKSLQGTSGRTLAYSGPDRSCCTPRVASSIGAPSGARRAWPAIRSTFA